MVQAFRFGGYTGPTDSGSYFPVSTSNKDGEAKASAGPFSVSASMSSTSTFTWTPLTAQLNVGSSFGLSLSTGLTVVPAGVALTWTPALPASTGLIAGAAAALVAMPAIILGSVGMSAGSGGKNAVDMSAYLALISAALAMVAIQKNITFELNLPLLLKVDLNPLLVVKKNEGEAATFTGMDAATDVFKWENNTANTGAALGIVDTAGSQNDTNAVNAGANAQQNRLAGTDNSS